MQAARGTSLSDAGPSGMDGRSPLSRRRRALAVFALTAAAWYAADQATKVLAVHRLADGDVAVPGGFLRLHLVRNPGAAFSTGTEYTVALSCFAIAAALVVLWVARRLASSLWAFGLGLLLAGVVGNLTDRLLRQPGPLRGHVIDFLQLPSWPVFNLADIGINVAAGLILLQAFRGVRVDGLVVEDDDEHDDEHHDGADHEGGGENPDDADQDARESAEAGLEVEPGQADGPPAGGGAR